MSTKTWDIRFLNLAYVVSGWSKDPSTRVGAVIVRPDKTVASIGFNGFPRGASDEQHLYEDRRIKYERVVHAEMNAILHAREPLHGYTLYVWPPGPGPTCARCAAHILQTGITRVVGILLDEGPMSERWKVSCDIALGLYREAGVEVDMYAWDEYGGK